MSAALKDQNPLRKRGAHFGCTGDVQNLHATPERGMCSTSKGGAYRPGERVPDNP